MEDYRDFVKHDNEPEISTDEITKRVGECLRFVKHIENHLIGYGYSKSEARQQVCCKICGKTIKQIYKEK